MLTTEQLNGSKRTTMGDSHPILPPEQVHRRVFRSQMNASLLIPDSKTKDLINQADMGDPNSKWVVDSMPDDVVPLFVVGRTSL